MDLPPIFPLIYNNPFSPKQHQHEIYDQTSSSFSHFGPQQVLVVNNNNVDDFLQIPIIFPQNDVELPKERKTSLLLDNTNTNNNEGDGMNPNKKSKKIIHREIERQRRLEMSSLHASLKSLLPHDSTKGKRAMSDHLGEAIKYITHLQQNMKELHEQRDALKREVYLKTSENNRDGGRDVKVEPCKGGVDVTVSTSCDDEGLPLSKVVRCLSQHGFDVVSCISKRLHHSNKLIHSIQAQYIMTTEVGDGMKKTSIDAEMLRQKLKDL